MAPERYVLTVSDLQLEDLKQRLDRTRWPDQTPGDDPWVFGTSVAVMRQLAAYWSNDFDWRSQEAELNDFAQYRVELGELPLHFLHVPGRGADPMPLLLNHGWPGSVFEFLDLIPRLSDPERFGGDAADSFTVVAPSLPGYGLSFRPGQKRVGIAEIADCLADLMTGVLGYERFAVQGGDWGAHIATALGVRRPHVLTGMHLNLLPLSPQAPPPDNPTEDEYKYLEEQRKFSREESGYTWIQGTRPQTLAFALTDSPAGLGAWIVEKMRAWSDHDGQVDQAISRDRMLANISLYWFTGAIGSSFWPYYDQHHGAWPIPPGGTVGVPVGYAAFPHEIQRPPRTIAERSYTSIRRWTQMPRGGHFPALEEPDLLAQDIAAFFRPLRH